MTFPLFIIGAALVQPWRGHLLGPGLGHSPSRHYSSGNRRLGTEDAALALFVCLPLLAWDRAIVAIVLVCDRPGPCPSACPSACPMSRR